MVYGEIFKQLQKSKVKYLVIGGVAVNLHGFSRLTADLDIMLLLEDENIEKFLHIIKRMGFRPRIPVPLEYFADAKKRQEWIKEKGMKAFSVYNPQNNMESIDIVIDAGVDFDKVYKKRVVMKTGFSTIPVVSLDDLILIKRKANRGRDRIDAGALEEIKKLKYGNKK